MHYSSPDRNTPSRSVLSDETDRYYFLYTERVRYILQNIIINNVMTLLLVLAYSAQYFVIHVLGYERKLITGQTYSICNVISAIQSGICIIFLLSMMCLFRIIYDYI